MFYNIYAHHSFASPGKRLGVPIWQLLGGKVRDRCKVYGWIGGDKPHDVVAGAEARQKQGFTAVKMNGTGPYQSSRFHTITLICFAILRIDSLGGLSSCFGGNC